MLSELKGEANSMEIDIHALDTDTDKLCQTKAQSPGQTTNKLRKGIQIDEMMPTGP